MKVWYTEVTIPYKTRNNGVLDIVDRHLSHTENGANKYISQLLENLNDQKLQEILGDLWEDGDTFIGTEYCDFMIQLVEVE